MRNPILAEPRFAGAIGDEGGAMSYPLDGDLLEVCDCRVLCPCSIGEIPDNGTCRGPTGEPTRLIESIVWTIPGSPAYVGKANTGRAKNAKLGIDLNLPGHSAIQGRFSFTA
jgi:hypothetical protein